MRKLRLWVGMISMLCVSLAAGAGTRDELYEAVAIVTGQGEENRQPGFRDCLDRVLLRVSGDPRLSKLPQMREFRAEAGRFVRSFSYRDRLEGIPIHDEQGTYDRPHDLTCRYEPEVIDRLLAQLGSRPWLETRPRLAIFLDVRRGPQSYDVLSDADRDKAMREAFDAAATPLGFTVVFPTRKRAADLLAKAGRDRLSELSVRDMPATAEVPVFGRLTWSDKDLGWVATWRTHAHSAPVQWTVRGVSFDEAFRVAVKGMAQILSGNGNPAPTIRSGE